MVVWVYITAVCLFVLVFRYSGFAGSCGQILTFALDAIEIVTDRGLDDDAKGNLTRKTAFRMLGEFSALVLKTVLIIAATIFPFWLADYSGVAAYSATSSFATRPDVVILTTLGAGAAWYAWRRFQIKNTADAPPTGTGQYSRFDRFVHDLAFGSNTLARVLMAVERKYYSKLWSEIPAKQPIFITSLPRAGTTILLEALHRTEVVATHTYRDMPFVLAPVLWSRFTARFRARSAIRERSHGDGLRINEDSPEAFEEVLWIRFFPHKYSASRIGLWKQADKRFTEFFFEHMQKIIALRCPECRQSARYASKNNTNIARIPALKEMFPDACILIPFRDPFEQAASLLSQHRNFFSRQGEEPFVRKYMSDIGHFEFGALHRLIRFADLEVVLADMTPDLPDYWLAYWVAAFEHLKRQQGVTFVSYETLVTSGVDGMERLCRHLRIDVEKSELEQIAGIFHGPRQRPRSGHEPSEDLSHKAEGLHRELQERCILQRQSRGGS